MWMGAKLDCDKVWLGGIRKRKVRMGMERAERQFKMPSWAGSKTRLNKLDSTAPR